MAPGSSPPSPFLSQPLRDCCYNRYRSARDGEPISVSAIQRNVERLRRFKLPSNGISICIRSCDNFSRLGCDDSEFGTRKYYGAPQRECEKPHIRKQLLCGSPRGVRKISDRDENLNPFCNRAPDTEARATFPVK